jgi:glucose/mannose transport system permease protein
MSGAEAILAAKPERDFSHSSMTARIVIYGLLGFFAIVYLLPLVVMVMTSLKPLDEVTGGNMLALPRAPISTPGPKPGALHASV